MADREAFDDPKFAITKVYTRTGDDGQTGLVGGQRVAKDDLRIEAYGTVDELNAVVGLCRAEIGALAAGHATPGGAAGAPDQAAPEAGHDPGPATDAGDALATLDAQLVGVQHRLFNLGAVLATLPEDVRPRQPRVTDADVTALEAEIDRLTPDLPPLRSFVLPGGSRLNALLHLARTVCRRAERIAVALHRQKGCTDADLQYLNRLSDAFFVWSRAAAASLGHDEVLWDPNAV